MAGILISVAKRIVDDGFFRLGWSKVEIDTFTPKGKLNVYCRDGLGLRAMKNHIQGEDGLGTIGCTIRDEDLNGISLGSSYSDLYRAVANNATTLGGKL